MRRFAVSLALILAATTASAADPEAGKTQFSIFTSNLGYSWSRNHYSARTGGLGLAISHAFTRNWGLELKVADEKHYGGTLTYTNWSTPPAVTYRTFHATPVDLLARYQFPNSSRWTPYVSAGVHHVFAPTMTDTLLRQDAQGNVTPFQRTSVSSRTIGEVGAGTSLRITPHFGLRFDVNTLVGPGRYYDDTFRPSIGVNWRF